MVVQNQKEFKQRARKKKFHHRRKGSGGGKALGSEDGHQGKLGGKIC